jgi:uncharacterized membrane protein
MLDFLSLIIKLGIEYLFILMLLTNFLQLRKRQTQVPYIVYGSLFGAIAAIIIYIVKKYVIRLEFLDLVEKGFLFTCIVFCLILIMTSYQLLMEKIGKLILFLFAFIYTLVQVEILLLAAIPQLSAVNGMNTEWIGKMAAAILAFILLFLMAFGIKKLGPKLNHRFVFIMLIFQMLILFSYQLTELLQLLFSLQILPLTMWALEILSPLVNHKDVFFYVLTVAIIFFLIFTSISLYRNTRNAEHHFTNPAEKRKAFAQSLKIKRWFYCFASVQILFFSFLAGAEISKAKAVEADPPVEVTANGGNIHISNELLKEKELNVFSYVFPDKTEVRFLVVGKTNENYGVALDACAICGLAGYYQKGDQIICKKCNSVINVNTIGFTGGCNPIPLVYESKGSSGVDISVSELEKSKSIFQ